MHIYWHVFDLKDRYKNFCVEFLKCLLIGIKLCSQLIKKSIFDILYFHENFKPTCAMGEFERWSEQFRLFFLRKKLNKNTSYSFSKICFAQKFWALSQNVLLSKIILFISETLNKMCYFWSNQDFNPVESNFK